MEETNPQTTSLALDKYVKFVESSIHWDAECGESSYFDAVKKMESAEGFFQNQGRQLSIKSLEEDLDPMCIEFAQTHFDYQDAIHDIDCQVDGANTRKEILRLREKAGICTHKYYMKIGELMQKYGVLKTLVGRSNAAFKKVGADFMYCTEEMAFDEFYKSSKDAMPILHAKIAFAINKLVKYWDGVEYGDLLQDDQNRAKKGIGDNRLKFISKLKTDYLKKFMDIILCTYDDSEMNKLVEQRNAEYTSLFGEYFDNLDFGVDVLKIHAYELRKNYFYEAKLFMIGSFITTLSVADYEGAKDQKTVKDIKRWGIGKDERGHLLLGIDLKQYPMPITVHIPKSGFKHMLKEVQKTRFSNTYTKKLAVPVYKSLTGKQGVFPTNILFKATPVQRQKLEQASKENPNNPYLQFFYSQTLLKDPNVPQPEMKDLRDFDE
jgi:hypothetical protein